MDSCLRKLAAGQAQVVAAWQLRAAGWSPRKVDHHAHSRGWLRIHRGVYALTHGEPTRFQLWWAATLTVPGTVLSHGSAAACFGLRRFHKPYEVVTRPGQGGRRRSGRLVVFRSKHLDGEVTRHLGIPITTAARVLVDIAPGLEAKQLGRCFREAIRLRTTTATEVLGCVERRGGRPVALGALARRYATLPYARTRSDAEGRALELLYDAGVELPRVNIRIAGEEADLVWLDRRLIVEIDGPQFHQFRDEDARKVERWRGAGYTVRRVPSDLVYDAPRRLLATCADPVPPRRSRSRRPPGPRPPAPQSSVCVSWVPPFAARARRCRTPLRLR